MKPRLVKGLVLAVLVAAGVWFYRVAIRPDPRRLEDWAKAALVEIFGPDVRYDDVEVDLLGGVKIENLQVEDPANPSRPRLWAQRVIVKHDVLAMTSGILRLRELAIDAPVISMHETPEGDVKLDFPFEIPKGGGGGGLMTPAVTVTNGSIWFRAAPESRWLAPGSLLTLADLDIATRREEESGALTVEGKLRPEVPGIETPIRIEGTADPDRGTLKLSATWDPLFLRPQLLAILSGPLQQKIESQHFEEGPHSLSVTVTNDPEAPGRLVVVPRFRGNRRMDIAELPGAETIDATTREQLNELFGKIALDVQLSGDRIDIRELTTSLGSGRLTARGRVEEGGEVVSVDLTITGLDLVDPALRRALGPLGDRIFSEFRLEKGTVDATVHLERNRGTPFTWRAEVFLQDASMAYLGRPHPEKKTPWGTPLMDGFPYAMEHAYGLITAKPGEIVIDGIEGRNGAAVVRIRGNREKALSGGETGFVRWREGADPDLRVTVEAIGVPVDHELLEAVRGSEFADFGQTYEIGGTIDRALVDVYKERPTDDKAFVDVEITVSDETFRFAKFPLPLEKVVGSFSLRRPIVDEQTRGKVFRVAAKGEAAGGNVEIDGDLRESERRGRIRVRGDGLQLEGAFGDALRAAPIVSEDLRSVWAYLAPKGEVDVSVDVPAYEDPDPERIEVALRFGTFFLGADRPESCPCLTDVTGKVVSVGADATIERLEGLLEGSPVSASGSISGGPAGRWNLTVSARGLRLTDPVLDTIHDLSAGKGLLPPGFAIRPGGRMDLTVRLLREPDEPAFRAEVDAKDVDITVNVGALPVRVQGDLYVAGEDVRLEDLTAEGSGVRISIPSARVTDQGLVGTARAKLTDVEAGPEVLSLLPEGVRDTIASVTKDRLLEAVDLEVTAVEGGETTLRGRLGLKARANAPPGGAPRGYLDFAPLVLSPPDATGARTLRGTVRFLGLSVEAGLRIEEVAGEMTIPGLRLGDAPQGDAQVRIDSARVGGLLVERLGVTLAWRGDALRIQPVRGTVYGGSIEGQVVVRTRAPESFEGRATITGLSLDRLFADVGGSDYRGTANAVVEFRSPTGRLPDLVGSGHVSVVCADLGELPIVANIPALLAGIVPGARKPKFNRAEMSFTIARETLYARPIVLRGPLYEMEGSGTLDSSGWLDITFKPEFLKQLLVPGIMQMPVLGDLAGLLPESALYVVRIRGPISDPKTTLVPLPYFSRGRAPPPHVPTPSAPPPPPSSRVPRWFR